MNGLLISTNGTRNGARSKRLLVCVSVVFVGTFASCISLRPHLPTAPARSTDTPKIIVHVLATSAKHGEIAAHTRQAQPDDLHPSVSRPTPAPTEAALTKPHDTALTTPVLTPVLTTVLTPAAPIENAAIASIDAIAPVMQPDIPPTPTTEPPPQQPHTLPDLPVIGEISANVVANELQPATIDDLRTQLLALHNQARLDAGLLPYQASAQLQQAAQSQANFLASQPAADLMNLGLAGHIGPNGDRASDRALRFGYHSNQVSENWAYDRNTQAAFDFWLFDPWHRPQVLSVDLTEVGFGISAQPEFGTIFVAVYGRP